MCLTFSLKLQKLLMISIIFSFNPLDAEYLVFVSSRSLKTSEKYSNWDNLVCLSLYIFWGKCVYFSIFEWQNSQLCQKNPFGCLQFGKIGVLVTSLKQYTNWDKLSCLSSYIFQGNERKYFSHISGLSRAYFFPIA